MCAQAALAATGQRASQLGSAVLEGDGKASQLLSQWSQAEWRRGAVLASTTRGTTMYLDMRVGCGDGGCSAETPCGREERAARVNEPPFSATARCVRQMSKTRDSNSARSVPSEVQDVFRQKTVKCVTVALRAVVTSPVFVSSLTLRGGVITASAGAS
eukprot:5190084-Pleurochrysis_carterae.AAC.1